MANYPWPSTVNFANFVTVRPLLNRNDPEGSINDYKIWKEQMLCLLEGQELWGFIDGQIPSPSRTGESTDHQEHKLWRRTDMLIKGWILGSLGNDALAAVANVGSSRDVWLKLENIFNKISYNHNRIQNQIFDYPSNEGREEGAAAGGVRNDTVADQDGIVELEPYTHRNGPRQNNGARKDYTKYLSLRRAITRADWAKARALLEEDREARRNIISEIDETALLVAVAVGKKSNYFVKELLNSMTPDALAIQNSYGNTALHRAAMIGNKEIVDVLLDKNAALLYIQNKQEYLPVHIAATYCHKGMLVHLIRIHEKRADEERHIDRNPFVGQLGASLLLGVIVSQYIDVALYLVQKYRNLAALKNQSGTDALYELARSGSVFESGANFSWWRRWIYSFPFVKKIKDKKVMHQQALDLIKCLCRALENLPSSEASTIYGRALSLAAQNNIREVVEVILDMFPTAINTTDTKTEVTIFHVAARARSENVFNLLHQMKEGKHFFYDCIDSSNNNYMHMCGEQAPTHKLNLVSGAALQMQRELHWFKEMEKFVTPSRRTSPNKEGKTPQMLFTEKHQELKTQGEKWMKDTATSCTIAAALIATVVFAAPFTVPGGVNNGIPVFVNNAWFITFALSDSVSLFSSTTSLLMFLSILTSRYAEQDFLYVLPTRLCIGLLTLFTSIISMMIAFSSAIYITLRHESKLFLIPLAVLAFFPVASFVFSQFPLLIAAMYSTYGPGIFREKSPRKLY
ncbi:uncharacterized protein LOC142506209 isoform X2 [Primulina tabacum]|uniref:uncharacterized protein LOC142506209 isoform X2 n=1 Tax=Primulina tabacum TaxID=48773 RepID=UPI003F59936F